MNFSECIETLIAKKHLSEQESFTAMKAMLSGQIPPAQMAGFLTSLRAKGETAQEIVGFVRAMKEAMLPLTEPSAIVLDTCGTGGDHKHTFNISTAAAFVVAGAGWKVAKHGNRSVSSQCGSADVLEALGVKVDMSPEKAQECLHQIGMTFLFAPIYHPAMKQLAGVRKELGIRTVFNLLGPLLNPASANAQVIGVPKKELLGLLSQVLKKLNHGKQSCALLIHEAGYDEMVLNGSALYNSVFKNKIQSGTLTPQQLGLKKTKKELLVGGNARQNAQILRDLLTEIQHPLQDVVVANAALAIACANRIQGSLQAFNFKQAVSEAYASIQSGAALKKLDQLIEYSQR